MSSSAEYYVSMVTAASLITSSELYVVGYLRGNVLTKHKFGFQVEITLNWCFK